jgi:hypothetical protein
MNGIREAIAQGRFEELRTLTRQDWQVGASEG